MRNTAEYWYMPARIEPDDTTYAGRFAIRLRKLREKAGYTVPQLTELTGIPEQTIYNWEAGNRRPPVETYPTLAKAFGVKVRTLLPDE